MLLDEPVHAARIGVHDFGGLRFEEGGFAVRGAAEAVSAKFPVDGDGYGSKNLRKLASRKAPQQVHLPEAVLRHDVTLGLHEIFH